MIANYPIQTKAMKKLEVLFYPTHPSATNTGMKFVLFKITTDNGEVLHDWGFADWTGDRWDDVPTPENFTCEVVWWSNTLSPDVLVKEKGKIIKPFR